MKKKKRKSSVVPKKYRLGAFIFSLVLFILGTIGVGISSTSVSLPIEGTPPKLYATQCRDDLCLHLQKALLEAKKSILIAIFSLTDPDIIRVLKEKASQGVDITIVYDEPASPGIRTKLGRDVKLIPRQGIKGLMHRKILIIDESQIWFGSANLTKASLHMHDNLIMGMHAPVIARLAAGKITDAVNQTYSSPTHGRDFILQEQPLELWFLPEDTEALPRLLQLIRGAKKTLRVAMYTFTHPAIADELILAHRRGVKVEVALDRQMSHGASSAIVQKLQQNHIPLGMNTGVQLLHHKFAYIDSTILVMGSANWTKAAFTKNEDYYLVLSQLTPEQQSVLDSLWHVIKCESCISNPGIDNDSELFYPAAA